MLQVQCFHGRSNNEGVALGEMEEMANAWFEQHPCIAVHQMTQTYVSNLVVLTILYSIEEKPAKKKRPGEEPGGTHPPFEPAGP